MKAFLFIWYKTIKRFVLKTKPNGGYIIPDLTDEYLDELKDAARSLSWSQDRIDRLASEIEEL